MQIFIGQIHNPNSGNLDDFDYLVVKTTEAEVITTITLKALRYALRTRKTVWVF